MSAEEILVTAATGETGRYTVQRLVEKGHAIRALVHREDERSEALRSAGAEIVVGDLLEHDDAIRATAYFADAAKRAGLEAVVNLSQISARENSKSHAARDHWIAERVFDWSGVPVVHLRPTFFAQWLLYPRSRATIVEEGIIDLPYGEGRHAPIAAEDQARLIAAILAEPAAHLGKTYSLHGPIEQDQAGIAAAVSEVLGRKITYRPLTIPQYRERLEKAGLPEIMIQHFCAVALDYQSGIFSGEDKIIAEVTGQPPMTVQEFVTLHRNAFTAVSAAG